MASKLSPQQAETSATVSYRHTKMESRSNDGEYTETFEQLRRYYRKSVCGYFSVSFFPPSCEIIQDCKSFFSNCGNKHLQGPSKRKVLKCYLSLELFVKLYLGFDAVPLKIKLQSGNL